MLGGPGGPRLVSPSRRRRTRGSHRRAWVAGVVVVVVAGGLAAYVAAHRRDHAKTGGRRNISAAVRSRGGGSARGGLRRVQGHAAKLADPFTTPATRTDLRARDGAITAAVEDLRTGQTWLYHPRGRAQTASIVKVDILETLLRQAQMSDTPLDDDDADLVQGMIENSNDDDATDLWDEIGGSSAVASYNAAAGLTQTIPNSDGFWGETTTSAADQIRLLRQLVLAHTLLNRASQDYELGLMENVEADQEWGVSGGVPKGADVALKNGWVPLTSDSNWEVNSIGRVKGDGRFYLIAVLTSHDPSEAYGIDTIEGLSRIVWGHLAAGGSAGV